MTIQNSKDPKYRNLKNLDPSVSQLLDLPSVVCAPPQMTPPHALRQSPLHLLIPHLPTSPSPSPSSPSPLSAGAFLYPLFNEEGGGKATPGEGGSQDRVGGVPIFCGGDVAYSGAVGLALTTTGADSNRD